MYQRSRGDHTVAKEEQMTFWVEPELRTAFVHAALLKDRPVTCCVSRSDVGRDLLYTACDLSVNEYRES